MLPCAHTAGDRVIINIKALPGASRTELAGIREGWLRVRIAAAPQDGRANAELLAFFAKTLSLAKRDVLLAGGEKSRQKRLSIPFSALAGFEKMVEG